MEAKLRLLTTKITGFSFIELLLGLLFLGLSFLLYARLQIEALRRGQAAYQIAFAQNQLSTMAECLRAAGLSACQATLVQWQEQNANSLQAGYGQVTPIGKQSYRITIVWKSPLSQTMHLDCATPSDHPTNCLATTIRL